MSLHTFLAGPAPYAGISAPLLFRATTLEHCPLPCRLYRADGEGGVLSWAEDNDFRACMAGACTALAWQQEPAGLQLMLATGSERGAEVPVSALHAHPVQCTSASQL